MVNTKINPKFLFLVAFTAAVGAVFFYTSSEAQAACSCPANVIDLSNWKYTLPTGSSEKPTEIKQPSLGNYTQSPFFLPLSDCDGVQFRAPVNGVTTGGSSYPRSELREMSNGGASNASWSTSSGTHVMYIDQAITSVPQSKKHVVAGQVHDSDDDVIVVRLEHPKLFIDINGKEGPVLDANYELGKRFTIKFVANGGKINIYYNGSSTPAYTLSKSTSGCYFKAGAYTQSNCEKESNCSDSNYGEVKIYQLSVGHSEGNSEPSLPIANSGSSSSSSAFENAQAGGNTVEAEVGAIKSPMQIVESASASNGKFIVQKAGSKKGKAGYTVNIPATGKYRIAGRVIAPNGSSNSFYYKIDAKKFRKWNFPNNLSDWTWTDGPVLKLKKGKHKLTIKKRETNTCLDTFELKSI